MHAQPLGISFLIASVAFMLLVNGAWAQSLASAEERQHDGRRNRVWSLHLTFQTCGVVLDSIRVARVEANGEVLPWQNANPDLLIIQWSRNLPTDVGYTLYDLLAAFSQRRYLVQLSGYGEESGNRFSRLLWVSPVGASNSFIDVAPMREDRSFPWTDEEQTNFLRWYAAHQWLKEDFFHEFEALTYKSDRKMDLRIAIKTPGCIEEEQ